MGLVFFDFVFQLDATDDVSTYTLKCTLLKNHLISIS